MTPIAQLISTPCGKMGIVAEDEAIIGIFFGGNPPEGVHTGTSPLLTQAANELKEYFAGARRDFTFATKPAGTSFQQQVWQALRCIPYGESRTYAEIAAQVGRPKAARAVGMANNRNPLAIVVPCHRVIGSTGKLTGYAAGIAIKEWLLTLERN